MLYMGNYKENRINHFFPLEMDEYSRLIPAVNRFPSEASGSCGGTN